MGTRTQTGVPMSSCTRAFLRDGARAVGEARGTVPLQKTWWDRSSICLEVRGEGQRRPHVPMGTDQASSPRSVPGPVPQACLLLPKSARVGWGVGPGARRARAPCPLLPGRSRTLAPFGPPHVPGGALVLWVRGESRVLGQLSNGRRPRRGSAATLGHRARARRRGRAGSLGEGQCWDRQGHAGRGDGLMSPPGNQQPRVRASAEPPSPGVCRARTQAC